jgi:hypothetical protein
MSTNAPAVMTAAPVDVPALLAFQKECLRTKNYKFIGKIMRIVFEVTQEMYIPPELAEDLKSDPMGPCIEFFPETNRLPVAQVEAAGTQSFLLPLAPCLYAPGSRVGFPDKPDRHWVPDKGPETVKVEDPDTHEISYKMQHEKPRMLEQPLRNFSRGILRGTNYIIYERVAQILVKANGIAEGWILKCEKNPADDTHMTFLLDRATGEAHFYGGIFEITRPGAF